MGRRKRRPVSDNDSSDYPAQKKHPFTNKRMRVTSSATTGGPSRGSSDRDWSSDDGQEDSITGSIKKDTETKRDTQKRIFEFVFLGNFNVEIWKFDDDLGLRSVELCQGTHGYKYAVIKLAKKKRAVQLEKTFQDYDSNVAPSMQIRLTKLPMDESLVSFGHGNKFMFHTIYKEIQKARDMNHPSYFSWSSDEDQDAGNLPSKSISRSTMRINHLLKTDMIQSSLRPVCSKQHRSTLTKIKRGSGEKPTRKKNAVVLDIWNKPSHDQSFQKNVCGLNAPLEISALCDIENAYASDQEHLEQQSGNLPQLSITPLLEDESSRDSTSSKSSTSSSDLSTRASLKKLRKDVKKISLVQSQQVLALDQLLDEHTALNYLATVNKKKDMELEHRGVELAAQKHKTKSQEGKTAAQTRKANLALQSEIVALEESAIAKTEAERERQLREKAEADKSTLMIANAGLSTALVNLSTGDKIEDWQLKNGYSHLKEFVSHLKHRKLTEHPNRRSLKGVAPALPFSDVTFRRYYDHALSYTDFKQASKSDDKHCLYLGLLSGPLYPKPVIFHFRERLLDQINGLCVELEKPFAFRDFEVDPLLQPIQDDPFDVDQLKAWKYTPGNIYNNEKMRQMRECFPGFEPRFHWQYLVFLHRCNFNGRLEKEDTKTILKMLQGPMYNEDAFVAMETPLLNKLIALRSELEEKHPEQYWKHNDNWGAIARQMQRARDSSHRAVKQDEGRANEYFVFARAQ